MNVKVILVYVLFIEVHCGVLAPSAGHLWVVSSVGALDLPQRLKRRTPVTLARLKPRYGMFNLTSSIMSASDDVKRSCELTIPIWPHLGGNLPLRILSWMYYNYTSKGVVKTVKHQTAENHVTWRVSSMAALGWGSDSTGLTPIAWLSLAFLVTCLSAGPGRRWRPEKRSDNNTERCSNSNTGHRSSSSTRSQRQKTVKRRACFCLGRWRKSSRIRRWRGASTASCAKPVRWRLVSGFVLYTGLPRPVFYVVLHWNIWAVWLFRETESYPVSQS